VDMTLLAHEALRRDLDEEPEVARVWNKALVRALLDDRVEAAVPDWSVGVEDVRAYYVANFENRGVLLEDAWRDIWLHLVAERRRERYDALVEQARGHTKVVVHDENVERHLGGGSGGG